MEIQESLESRIRTAYEIGDVAQMGPEIFRMVGVTTEDWKNLLAGKLNLADAAKAEVAQAVVNKLSDYDILEIPAWLSPGITPISSPVVLRLAEPLAEERGPGRMLDPPVSQLEKLYYQRQFSPDLQANLLALSQIPFTFEELNLVREAIGVDYTNQIWHTIRQDLTAEDLSRAGTRKERIEVHSQFFMAYIGERVPADSVETTKFGVTYKRGDETASFFRGVPLDEESAARMSLWASPAGKEYFFPVWRDSNDLLGQLMRCLVPTKGSYGVYPPPDFLRFNEIQQAVNSILRVFSKSTVKAEHLRVNLLQSLLYKNPTIHAILKENAVAQRTVYDAGVAKLSGRAGGLVSNKTHRDKAVLSLKASRRQRNEVLGKVVFHRYVYPLAGNFDLHDNLVWGNILQVVSGKGVTKLVVIGPERAKEKVLPPANLVVTHHPSDTLPTAIAKEALYFPVPWASGLVKKTGHVTHTTLETLQGCRSVPAGTYVFIRVNLEDPFHETEELKKELSSWLVLPVIKAGGGHSLDVTLGFVRRPKAGDDTQLVRLSAFLNLTVQYAITCNNWFDLTYRTGVISVCLPPGLKTYHRNAKGLVEEVTLANHLSIKWFDGIFYSRPAPRVEAEVSEGPSPDEDLLLSLDALALEEEASLRGPVEIADPVAEEKGADKDEEGNPFD